MVYKLRFVQYYDKKDTEAFWKWEAEFKRLEEETPGLKLGKRFIPLIGREPTNTMIWEAEYDSLEDSVKVLKTLEENSQHDKLLEEQIKYMRDTYVELYEMV